MFKDVHFIYDYFARMPHNNTQTQTYKHMRHSGQDGEKSGS